IENYVNETVKEAVQNALQAPVRERFRELSEFEMKEILRDRMFEGGSYISQLEHAALYESRPPSTHHWHVIMQVFKYLKKTMDYGLSYVGVPFILEGYSDASWITNSKAHTSTTGWVFLLGGATGNEAEWLRNLIYEILLWPKPISPIFIHCDSAATLAKAYCQIYNEKSRHLVVRLSTVRELIINGVIYVDFVRSQQNMTDHLTKGIARDLMHKSAIGMGLKSIKIYNDETPNSLLANAGS
nr:hypothetical protein [Tanacetum cinerariifolium]